MTPNSTDNPSAADPGGASLDRWRGLALLACGFLGAFILTFLALKLYNRPLSAPAKSAPDEAAYERAEDCEYVALEAVEDGIPLPEKSAQDFALAKPGETGGRFMGLYRSGISVDNIVTFYTVRLKKMGWRENADYGKALSGATGCRSMVFARDGRSLQINIYQPEGRRGGCDFRISVTSGLPVKGGY
jgi:hypothetical protein